MNMSCLNANAMAQHRTVDARMKQLFYSLESLPTELIFSDCARLGSCTVDAWIPCEVVPESFGGKHTLKLGPAGFSFETRKGAQALKFFLLSSAHRLNRFRLSLPAHKGAESLTYNVEALCRTYGKQTAVPTDHLCIVVNNGPPKQGARFIIHRVVGRKYFLHFDCPIRLTEINDSRTADNARWDPHGVVGLDGDFIIERNHEPQNLSMSRPQNLEQHNARAILIGWIICRAIGWGERLGLRATGAGESRADALSIIVISYFLLKRRIWMERTIHAFVHRAWMVTYRSDWDPNGPWKWYWKLSNWKPPIPFETLVKYGCYFQFYLSSISRDWSGMASATLYWLFLFPKRDLIKMYTAFILANIIVLYFPSNQVSR